MSKLIPPVDGYYYLATPYSKYRYGMETAFIHACVMAGAIMKLGHSVYCPIAYSHPVAKYGEVNSIDHDFWMKMDLPLVKSAEGLIIALLPGWSNSDGVAEEVENALNQSKPVLLVYPSELGLACLPDGESPDGRLKGI